MITRSTKILTVLGFVLFLVSPGSSGELSRFSAAARLLDVDTSLIASADTTKFEHNRFVTIDRAPVTHPGPEDDVVRVLDEKGRQIFQKAPGLDVPDAWLVNVRDATLRSDERLVVAVFARSKAGQDAAALVEYDLRKGELIRIVRTYPVDCRSVRGDSTGVVWCAGFDMVQVVEGRQDYDLVYMFDRDGLLVGSSLPRTSFPARVNPFRNNGPERYGFIRGGSSPRLLVPAVRTVIDFDLKGGVAGQTKLPAWPLDPNHVSDLVFARHVLNPQNALVSAVWTTSDAEDSAAARQEVFRFSEGDRWALLDRKIDRIPLGARIIGSGYDGLIFMNSDRVVVLPGSD